MDISKFKKRAFTLTETLVILLIMAIIFAIYMSVYSVPNPTKEGWTTISEKTEIALEQASTGILLNNCIYDDYKKMRDSNGYFSIEDKNIEKRFSDLYKRYLQDVDINIDSTNEYFSKNIKGAKKELSNVPLKDLYNNFFLIQDGVLVGFRLYNSCSATEKLTSPAGYNGVYETNDICGSIFYDVNSYAKPNKLGLDQHIVAIYSRGLKYD